jgi:hypothetical protein
LSKKHLPSEAEKHPPEEAPVFYLKVSSWQKVRAMVWENWQPWFLLADYKVMS